MSSKKQPVVRKASKKIAEPIVGARARRVDPGFGRDPFWQWLGAGHPPQVGDHP